MKDRQDRILMPSAIALVSMLMTLWATAGFGNSPLLLLPFTMKATENQLALLVKIVTVFGVTNLGIGYACQSISNLLMFWCSRMRIVDLRLLATAFGFDFDLSRLKGRARRELVAELLAEFHLRFHSHAPPLLINHGTRRNTAWYMALNSSFASILASLFALILILCARSTPSTAWKSLCRAQLAGLIVSGSVFVVLYPIMLAIQAWKWNKEYWAVCWKWIGWDLGQHPDKNDLWHSSMYQKFDAKPTRGSTS